MKNRHWTLLWAFGLALFTPTELMAKTIGADLVDFKDVDVYEYAYRNWDNANFARWGSMSISSGMGTRRRVYIWFDVNALKAESGDLDRVELVLSASLAAGSQVKINVHRVTSQWNPGNGTYHSGSDEPNAAPGQISWNNQPAWDAQTVWTSVEVRQSNLTKIRFDITKLVAAWASGEVANLGLVIVGENEASGNYKVVFDSIDSSVPERRPVIAVNEGGSRPCMVELWGTQKKGWGHTVNAEVDGNKINLASNGVILSQSGENAGFTIWSGGSPFLTVNPGGTAVGQLLPPGEYSVLAGLGERLRLAEARLCIDELGVSDPGSCEVKLIGKQKAGWGHSVNAETISQPITLQTGGTIVSEKGDYHSYSIWSGGPQPVLYVAARQNDVGQTLPPGTYTALPGLDQRQSLATVTICFDETEVDLSGGCDLHLRGKHKEGWGHSVNAETSSQAIVLQSTGTIVGEKGTFDGYSIWSGGSTPVLYIGPGQSGAGRTLPPGKYTVLPGLKQNVSTATIDVCIKLN